MPTARHELQHPTDIMFSFEGFRRRGGITDHHADGFGIGFLKAKAYACFRDDKLQRQLSVADLGARLSDQV